MKIPAALPTVEIKRVSASSWRMRRNREAPSAALVAISRWPFGAHRRRIGDVGAGAISRDAADTREQNQQNRSYISGKPVAKRLDAKLHVVAVNLGPGRARGGEQDFEIRAGLGKSDAGPGASDGVPGSAGAAGVLCLHINFDGHERIDLRGARIMEALRQHSHNLARTAIEDNRFLKDLGIARKLPLPHPERNNDGQRRVEPGFLREKSAAQHGGHFENIEKIRGDPRGIYIHGAIGELKRIRPDFSHGGVGGEDFVVARPIEIIPGGDEVEILARKAGRNRDEAVRFGIRQRTEQHRVDHAEDRGGGADAEGQSEDGGDGEARVADQGAAGKAKIIHGASSPLDRCGLHGGRAGKRRPRPPAARAGGNGGVSQRVGWDLTP